jgi:hypothetical protein
MDQAARQTVSLTRPGTNQILFAENKNHLSSKLIFEVHGCEVADMRHGAEENHVD